MYTGEFIKHHMMTKTNEIKQPSDEAIFLIPQ